MKILLNKTEKITIVIIICLLLCLILKSLIKDYEVVSHNQKVYQSLPEYVKKQMIIARGLVVKGGLNDYKYLFYIKNIGRFPMYSNYTYYPTYLDTDRVFVVLRDEMFIYDARINELISKISFEKDWTEKDWTIFYASNLEADKNIKGTYYFYILHVQSEYKGNKLGRVYYTDNAVLCKYRIENANNIIRENEHIIKLPKDTVLNTNDGVLPFLFKEYDEKITCYIPLHNDNFSPYDVFELDLKGNITETDIKDIDCLFLNSANDNNIYYSKKINNGYTVFKNDKSFTSSEDTIIYGRILSTGEIYMLKGYKNRIDKYVFNFIQLADFLWPRGYVYEPTSEHIRPLYFLSYESLPARELPSILLRGFFYLHPVSIIPYN
ncbi:hypothetical protein [Treponema pedis]|uniref:Uncharacterized protein n=2 Tax=Treponema pedis TaxID=409322 RepID=S6A8M3_9SPIR|nr:hypothetical protein [Treponema pedis]AGT44079.1 hypothetical protein TPE_1587 [Treponema pedis str. T A4]